MRPTAELAQHHDLEAPRVGQDAFRQAWLVRTRLDQLLAAKRITPDEWQAAIEYRHTWAVAMELSGADPAMVRVTSAGTFDAATVARLDATTKLRVIEAVIGTLATKLLIASVIKDLTWAAIGRACRRSPHTVQDWTVLAIRALAPAWAGYRPVGAQARSDLPETARPPCSLVLRPPRACG